MGIKQNVLRFLHFLATMASDGLDVRDFFLFAGLFFTSYGLWLLAPWIGFTVGGFLLMILALLMRSK